MNEEKFLVDYFNECKKFLNKADIADTIIEAKKVILATKESGGQLIFAGNGASAAATATVSGGAITAITMTNVGTGYRHAVVTISGGGGSGGVVRPVIGPIGGFGKDATNDLRSHYVTINTVFTGDESGTIPDSNDFRQIAVLKNPI